MPENSSSGKSSYVVHFATIRGINLLETLRDISLLNLLS